MLLVLNAAYVGKLQDLSITVKIAKINSHLGILENDMADRYAKEMASKISKAEIIAPRNISVNDCYKIAADIVLKSWQRYWDNEKKGRSTYDFIPVVGTKVILPSKRFSGAVYCRMLLHDTMLKKRQLQNWYCRHSYMRLWKCIGNNRTFVTLLQQI